MESSGSSSASSDDDSFDEEGPTSYQDWRAYIVKTYLNGKEPRRQIYEVSDNLLLKERENVLLPQAQSTPTSRPKSQPSARPYSRQLQHQQQLQQQLQPPQSLPLQRNPLKHHLPLESNKSSDGHNFKAKVAKKANQSSPQCSRPVSSSSTDSQKADHKRFKKPDRDASGNLITFETTSNPFAVPKSTTVGNNNSNHSKNGNTSMSNNHNNFATVTSSLNKTTSIQTSKPSPPPPPPPPSSSSSSSSSRVSKGSNHPENNIVPIVKSTPAAHLKARSDVFWTLNSAAKLLHVKTQLDEPSKIYLDKLVKSNTNYQSEIAKLRKDKQDLQNIIKMVEKVISDPTGARNSS
ncbi:putative protein TPRXL [Panonychus citri]|uniref:putative protein TPRXL n=1 Tax=Panonychus citri TaxID=50023 RepID=UPI002307D284|nr:putative protein TPRXL [Panonychus citri]